MRWTPDLRFRLLAVILLVLLPAAAIIAYDVYDARSQQVANARRLTAQLAKSIVASQERVVSHVEALLDLLGRVPQIRRLEAAECSSILTEIVRTQPRYAIIMALDKAGKVICSSNSAAIGQSAVDRTWFQRSVETGDFTIGDYRIGAIMGRPTLGFAQPLRTSSGALSGVVYAAIDVAWFGANEAAQNLPENADFTLIDDAGLVMARYPESDRWSGKSTAGTALFTALQGIEHEADIEAIDLDGKKDLFHLLKLQRTPQTAPIYLAVGLEIDGSMQAINRDMLVKITLLLAVAVLLSPITYLTSARIISKPIRNIVALSSRLAGGDLSVRSNIDHDSGEFGTLARSLDTMAQSLQEHQKKLIEQQRYMRAVLDNTSEMILGFDNNGVLAFTNAAARAVGMVDGAMSYKDVIALYDAVFDQSMSPMAFDDLPLVRVIRGETVYNAEVLARVHRDDPVRTMLVNGQPIHDADGLRLGIVIAVRDITDLRAAEASLRQAQKMEAVGQLTGGIAHDFNNLLSIVIGNIDTLLPHLRVPRDIELANEALNGALRGASLTRQMLAFARRQTLDPKIIDLTQHLPEIAAMLRRTLGEDISVTDHCAADLWPCLVDSSQLDSVLLNFAINARDAMPQGGNLTIEATNFHLDDQYAASNAEVTPGDYIRLATSDTGQGIPAEILGRVMEPFFTTKPPGQGTGLGLSMAFGFAKQSGGHLKIYSEVGQGTTINLYLPRAGVVGRNEVAETTAPDQLSQGRETVLLVDDNEGVRKTAARQLIDLGYRVIEADNATGALDVLANDEKIDLLFSDVVMPGGLNGFDLAAKAEVLRPNLKILLVTGFAEAAIKNRAAQNGVRSGAVQLLSKPYRRQELAQRMRALLDAAPLDTQGN